MKFCKTDMEKKSYKNVSNELLGENMIFLDLLICATNKVLETKNFKSLSTMISDIRVIQVIKIVSTKPKNLQVF